MKEDLRKQQKTSHQGGCISAGIAENSMEISTTFANLAQTTVEDHTAVTNMTTANITLTKQVDLYANLLSTKEADNVEMQIAMKKIHGEVKNLKTKVTTLKRSGHSGDAIFTENNRGRPEPKWKREGQYHHPT